MNSRAQLVRRLCGDLVQRLRIALSSSGDDAAQYVDKVDRQMAEDIAGDVCATIGIDYEGPPEMPRRKSDGRPAPWARKGGAKSKHD